MVIKQALLGAQDNPLRSNSLSYETRADIPKANITDEES